MEILNTLVTALAGIPPWLATIILAMIPIGELRGALPVALIVYKLPIIVAAPLAIIGNMLPVYLLLIFFERAAAFIRANSETGAKALDWLFERTRRKLHDKVLKYGPWALALFVAIPLPVTGAWTGTLAAFVFGLDKKKAFLAILLGVIISSVIVTVLTVGIDVTVRATLGL